MSIPEKALLPSTWRKEDFSYAYAFAIAAASGVAWDIPRRDVNSCDVRFYGRDSEATDAPQLFAQLKCTADGLRTNQKHQDHWRFSLEASDYKHLRVVKTHPPRILVVVRCPNDTAEWVKVSPLELLLRAEAWWVDLAGEDELPDGQDSITVSIPQSKRFDPTALLTNMRSCP